MTDWLETNLNAVRERHPQLYDRLSSYFARTHGGKKCVLTAEAGFSNLEFQEGEHAGRKLYWDSPEREYEKSLALSALKAPRILILDGFGLGYHFKILSQSLPRSVRDILVVEKSFEVFANALKIADWREALSDGRFEFFVGLELKDFAAEIQAYLLQNERLIYTDRTEHFYFEPALTLDGPYYVAFSEAFAQGIKALKSLYVTPGEDNYRALANIVRNARHLPKWPWIQDVPKIFQGWPVAIIGAGPSLAGELANLKKYRHKFGVIAADAALLPLLNFGIVPDAVVSVERVASMRHLFDGLPKDCAVPLFTLPSIHPEVLRRYGGPIVFMKRRATFGDWLRPDLDQMIVPLGVSSVAYSVAVCLGANEIFLFGQDLAFGKGTTLSHVAGTSEYVTETTSDYKGIGLEEITGNSGETLKTTRFWKEFHAEFERLIPFFGLPCRHVIHPNEGARIHGAVLTSPGDFWSRCATDLPDVSFDFGELQPRPGSLDHLNAEFKATADYLDGFAAAMLSFLEKLSLDYHDRIDVMANSELAEVYEDALARWESWRQELIDLDANRFYHFLNCLFSGHHILTLSEREALKPEKDKLLYYMLFYMLKTGEWGREALAWALRASHLLKSYV